MNFDYWFLMGAVVLGLIAVGFLVIQGYYEGIMSENIMLLKAANLYGDKNLNDARQNLENCFRKSDFEDVRNSFCRDYNKAFVDRIHFLTGCNA